MHRPATPATGPECSWHSPAQVGGDPPLTTYYSSRPATAEHGWRVAPRECRQPL